VALVGEDGVLFITPKFDAQVTKRRHICIKGVKQSLRRNYCRSVIWYRSGEERLERLEI
jgi:hypothetical protein